MLKIKSKSSPIEKKQQHDVRSLMTDFFCVKMTVALDVCSAKVEAWLHFKKTGVNGIIR